MPYSDDLPKGHKAIRLWKNRVEVNIIRIFLPFFSGFCACASELAWYVFGSVSEALLGVEIKPVSEFSFL